MPFDVTSMKNSDGKLWHFNLYTDCYMPFHVRIQQCHKQEIDLKGLKRPKNWSYVLWKYHGRDMMTFRRAI